MSVKKTKLEKIALFSPDEVLSGDMNIFGMPFNYDEADIILLPVPWDVTVSYKDGTSDVVENIKKAALQIETFDIDYENAWHAGFFMEDIDVFWKTQNKKYRNLAKSHIESLSSLNAKPNTKSLNTVNDVCESLNKWVEEKCTQIINDGKFVGIVGGDHSCPLGLMRALAKKYHNFSVLQIDAHADLRIAYEGFTYSHASIMDNALKINEISRLVQLGIRDYGKNELSRIRANDTRIKTYFDNEINAHLYTGGCWADMVKNIIENLTEHVYISFDIDGLSPYYCPNTGTPVPGGLSFEAVSFLIKSMVEHNKKIIGFDLCEVGVSLNEWDESVASRLLYKLCCATAKSHNLIPVKP